MIKKPDKSIEHKAINVSSVYRSINEIEELEKELKVKVNANEENPTYEGYHSIIRVHDKLGKKYFNRYDYKKAVTHYKKVLDYKDKASHYTTDQLGVQLGIADTYEKLSEVYRNSLDFDMAEEYKERAKDIRKKAINALIE